MIIKLLHLSRGICLKSAITKYLSDIFCRKYSTGSKEILDRLRGCGIFIYEVSEPRSDTPKELVFRRQIPPLAGQLLETSE